jgi:hypothetical protein
VRGPAQGFFFFAGGSSRHRISAFDPAPIADNPRVHAVLRPRSMANRPHKTRQKLTFRLPPTKPRNPLVAPAIKRVAGPHRKSPSAERGSDRVALVRALKESDGESD